MKIKTRCRTLGTMLLLITWFLIASAHLAVADEATGPMEYETGFYYTVKEGDTLWDLSQKFSDSPWLWPDLWRENKQLPNPHWIYPGERIRLFRKTDQHQLSEAPAKENPVMVPQEDIAAAPLKAAKPQVEFSYANIDQVGFIRKPGVTPLGTIFKTLGDKTLISKGDIVYMRYADSGSAASIAPGNRMTVFRTLAPTEDRKSMHRIGAQHLLVGVIEITKKENDFAIAEVMKSYRPILLEDMVMSFVSRNPGFAVVDSTTGLEGQIISGENHNQLLSTHFVAFIDKGIQDNVLPGQIYNLYIQERAALEPGGKVVDLDRVYTGSFFVLHTEQTTSTVVITHNIQNITPGDRFQTP